MPRRRLALVVGAAVALIAVVVVVVVLVTGGDDDSTPPVADPFGRALSYVPTTAPLVAALDTSNSSEQGRALADLARELPAARFAGSQFDTLTERLGLDYRDDVKPLLGAPLVLAGPGLPSLDLASFLDDGGLMVLVAAADPDQLAESLEQAVDRGRLREQGAGRYAAPDAVLGVDGPVLLVARDAATVDRALDVRRRRAGMTAAYFTSRLGKLAGPALFRAIGRAGALIGEGLARVPPFPALRDAALSLRLEDPGARVRISATAQEARLTDAQLPLAPGAAAPQPAGGDAPIVIGVRDLSHTLDWFAANRDRVDVPALQPIEELLDGIQQVRGPLGTFGGIDVDEALLDQFIGTTTITQEAGGGFGLRAQLRDGGPLRTALDRISRIPDVALDLAGAGEFDLDRGDNDTYTYVTGSRVLRIAVPGNLLVVTDDTDTTLRELIGRRPEPAGGEGALAIRLAAAEVRARLVDALGLPGLAGIFLNGIGEARASVRAETSGIDIDAKLALGG